MNNQIQFEDLEERVSAVTEEVAQYNQDESLDLE